MASMVPLETSTEVNLDSVSKQFTAIAILMLAERGDLALEDSPADYIDGLPAWAEDLTLNDLMHHASGIADFTLQSPDTFGPPPITNPAILDWVRTAEYVQVGTPGLWSYSNTNYNLLADVIGAVTGEPFDSWMQANVFDPVDLDLELWVYGPSTAVGHLWEAGEFVPVENGVWEDAGSGGIMMTASELARWGDHIRTSSLVSAATFEQALADAVPRNVLSGSYGPGLIIERDGSLHHAGAGDDDGDFVQFAVSPDRHTTFAVSCNQSGIDIVGQLRELEEIWLGEALE